jgi:hypothetical protein
MMPVLLASVALGTAPPFSASARPVTVGELGASYHAGCPVGPPALRRVRIVFWGFDGRAHPGSLVVARTAVADVETVFRTLYEQRFPLRRVQPVSAFGGSDARSMAADNTSGFNCRRAVAPGPPRWSTHAYGQAIDVNPVENPYVEGGLVRPRAGRAYLDRSPARAGMAVAGGTLVRAFASVGWQWGGRWSATPDWQHFSATGG